MFESLDYKAAAFWFSVFQFLYMVAMTVWVWNANRHNASKQMIEDKNTALANQLSQHNNRLTQVERDLQHLPDHEDMSVIHTRINDSAQSLEAVRGELKQINNTMQLMHSYLLNGGKQ
ncbi:Uncharacterised protein [BD1-7 clade bacterium]|uniref:DUF2730 domain-containing protein n=1 Tax=BD1-7 clade bacterium TaxID=2029982 RepID=A0A5S9Q2E7_9GAMM|nr:Uncharacterised protein [BD1-7 clade bacterium]CAA0111732.1 Uncharacterised protein [BD1-7 clade bacterium]